MFRKVAGRQYVRKKATGAIWSSACPGVWRKETMGVNYRWDSCHVGYVTTQFYPFNKRNLRRFEALV